MKPVPLDMSNTPFTLRRRIQTVMLFFAMAAAAPQSSASASQIPAAVRLEIQRKSKMDSESLTADMAVVSMHQCQVSMFVLGNTTNGSTDVATICPEWTAHCLSVHTWHQHASRVTTFDPTFPVSVKVDVFF